MKVRNGIWDRIAMYALRVADLRRDAPDVRRDRDGHEVWDGVHAQGPRRAHDDRGDEKGDRVVQHEGGQEGGREHEPHEERGLAPGPRGEPRRYEIEETAHVEPGDKDHHPDEEENHIEVDRRDRPGGRQDAEDEHEGGAEHCDRRTLEGEPTDVPEGDQDVCEEEHRGRRGEGVRQGHGPAGWALPLCKVCDKVSAPCRWFEDFPSMLKYP